MVIVPQSCPSEILVTLCGAWACLIRLTLEFSGYGAIQIDKVTLPGLR